MRFSSNNAAIDLFLQENNRIQFNSVEDVLSRVQNSRKLKDLLSPALKTKKGSASVGQAYYWPPGVNVNSLMDVDRLLAYQLINSCGANPQIVWATGNVKTEQVTNWGFIDVI